ncbi:hypothetical protein KOW79_010951 [Hemibagrus wyckioides]|uniref:Uncharacterized protein n=1 Tax=Hemibagrus wyckioides TaxID=337641 RepID=A0A9D3NP11_9TELE|nr:hypothetical protein KOW79_010951 [Hemibagrus wyckioides]
MKFSSRGGPEHVHNPEILHVGPSHLSPTRLIARFQKSSRTSPDLASSIRQLYNTAQTDTSHSSLVLLVDSGELWQCWMDLLTLWFKPTLIKLASRRNEEEIREQSEDGGSQCAPWPGLERLSSVCLSCLLRSSGRTKQNGGLLFLLLLALKGKREGWRYITGEKEGVKERDPVSVLGFSRIISDLKAA